MRSPCSSSPITRRPSWAKTSTSPATWQNPSRLSEFWAWRTGVDLGRSLPGWRRPLDSPHFRCFGAITRVPMDASDKSPISPPAQPDEAPLAHPKPSHGLMGRIRTYFLTGLVLVGPIYITLNLTWWFINWVDELVRPLFPVAYRPETYLPVKIPGLGLV